MDAVKERVATLLQEYMNTTGKSQHDIAADLGVHQTMVSSYLRRAKCPSIKKLVAIAELTNSSVNEIVRSN